MGKSKKKLILLELNEVNFDVVEKYVAAQPDRFPSLKKILSEPRVRTTAESDYEKLEPWIQWPSVHTGMTFAEHGIFRLGDIVGSKVPQIFEKLEQAGYRVGAILAMNAENRLKQPAYFIPDPWTKTLPDESWWSRALTKAVSQTVNDNAQSRITGKSILQVLLAVIRFARPTHYVKYLKLTANSRNKPWLKTLILDLLVHDVHWNLFKRKQPNFSTLFLNAAAHIQHHYFFNAAPIKKEIAHRNPEWYLAEKLDPLADVLDLYDLIVGEIFWQRDVEVVLSTGLTQKPYDRLKFYYRLSNHKSFLEQLGIAYQNVYPRMARDFLIEFTSEDQAFSAQKKLGNLQVGINGLLLFNEIDNRGRSLFMTLTYPNEINDDTTFGVSGTEMKLKPLVSFVAVKNGMHHEVGFAFFTQGIARYAPDDYAHVSVLNKSIADFFGINQSVPSSKNWRVDEAESCVLKLPL